MTRIGLILADVAPARRTNAVSLTSEQWNDIFEANERGVTYKQIFAACSGKIDPFHERLTAFCDAAYAEKRRRADAKERK